MKHSLQRTLNRRVLTASAVFALLASAVSGWIAFNEARELQDSLLRQVAVLAASRPSASGLFDRDTDPEDTLVLQRLGVRSAAGLALPAALPDGLHTLTVNGVGWRVLVYTGQPDGSGQGQRLAVSQQTEARDEVAWNNGLHTLLPVLLLAPLLMAVVRLAVTQSMKPLCDLAEALDRRDERSLAALPTTHVPTEVVPFIAAINRLLVRLQRAITQQRRFVADAAHELRTPVTGLSLLAENLARAPRLEDAHARLQPLQAGLRRMQTLIAQLLDLARLQGESQGQVRTVALQPLVQEVIATLYPLAEHNGIDLGMTRNEALSVMDIAGDLGILVHNAVDNALRYTPAGGRVDVSLYAERGEAVFEVADTGSGIPEDELQQVFEPFYRVGVTTQPGNGLGLAISQEVAERLGGTITLRNRAAGGLCFRYRQPLAEQTPQR